MKNKLLKIDCLQNQFENEIKSIFKDKFIKLVFDYQKLAFEKEKAFVLLNNYNYIIIYFKKYTCTQNHYICVTNVFEKGGNSNQN